MTNRALCVITGVHLKRGRTERRPYIEQSLLGVGLQVFSDAGLTSKGEKKMSREQLLLLDSPRSMSHDYGFPFGPVGESTNCLIKKKAK